MVIELFGLVLGGINLGLLIWLRLRERQLEEELVELSYREALLEKTFDRLLESPAYTQETQDQVRF